MLLSDSNKKHNLQSELHVPLHVGLLNYTTRGVALCWPLTENHV